MSGPLDMGRKLCDVSVGKCGAPVDRTLVMGFLGGAYIALAGFFYTVVTQDGYGFVGVGLTRFVGGLAFSLGLLLVLAAGAELFTGNCLMPMPLLAGRLPLGGMLRNWCLVYLGNLLGAVGVAFLIRLSGLDSGLVGENALKVAAAKMSLPFSEAFFRGVLCNWLVALAVWMSYGADGVGGKAAAVVLPVTAFVACGFEHSVANMYFLALGLMEVGRTAPHGVDLSVVNLGGYLGNLVPVTLGNAAGASVLVAAAYWKALGDSLRVRDD
ncbi:MAG: formate/nitrite transporter family protein [Thermanaerothrix sp.]|nr:formate/nitrite transporter family protein [Thermanaerothrix sp.]